MLYLVDKKDPVLRMPTEPYDFSVFNSETFFEDMKEAMIRYNGLGLSANQVGILQSMFVFGDPSNPDSIQGFFNPTIVHYSDETTKMEEGCLSFPNVLVKVKRSESIRIRYTLKDGTTHTNTFSGLTARIIQHEFDHLQGKTFLDGLSKLKLNMIMKKAKKSIDISRK